MGTSPQALNLRPSYIHMSGVGSLSIAKYTADPRITSHFNDHVNRNPNLNEVIGILRLFCLSSIMSAGDKRKRGEYETLDDEEEHARNKQVLPIANLPFDFDGVPEDGAQYLFTVRYVGVPCRYNLYPRRRPDDTSQTRRKLASSYHKGGQSVCNARSSRRRAGSIYKPQFKKTCDAVQGVAECCRGTVQKP